MCFDRIDGAICGAMDIQDKCDCTLILLLILRILKYDKKIKSILS